MRCNCASRTLLVKSIERGGMLLRGNAPIVRIIKGRMVIEQRCPDCKKLTRYSPLVLRTQTKEGDHGSSDPE